MKSMKRWKVAGINFDHDHMGDNLRLVRDHPDAEIVGICHEDPSKMQRAIANFSVPPERVFTDYRRCLEAAKPDIVLLCPATARHAEWVLKVAPFGVHLLLEKPFAASLAEADRMIAAMRASGKREREKPFTWFYKREAGGGSLLDYLGYGATLGTWYHDGKVPIEVTTVVDEPSGLEVDEHSVTIARYDCGLSKFETRWGTHSDPWTHQPQPKCGFVIVGREGSIASYDFEKTVRLTTRGDPAGRDLAVDRLAPPRQNPVEYFIDCIATGRAVSGPLSPEISRAGQRIVDSAVLSAARKHTVRLA